MKGNSIMKNSNDMKNLKNYTKPVFQVVKIGCAQIIAASPLGASVNESPASTEYETLSSRSKLWGDDE